MYKNKNVLHRGFSTICDFRHPWGGQNVSLWIKMMVGGYCMCACFIALMLSKFLAKPSFKNGHLYILLVFFVFTEKKNELFRPSGNLLRPVVLHEILFSLNIQPAISYLYLLLLHNDLQHTELAPSSLPLTCLSELMFLHHYIKIKSFLLFQNPTGQTSSRFFKKKIMGHLTRLFFQRSWRISLS